MKIKIESPEKHTIFANNQWMISRKECSPMKTSASGNIKSDQPPLYNSKKYSNQWFDPMMLLVKKTGQDDPNHQNLRQTKKNLLRQIEKGLPDMKVESEIGGKNLKQDESTKSYKFFDESTFRKNGSIKKSVNKKQQKNEVENKVRKVSILSIKSIDSLHERSPQQFPSSYHKKPHKNNIFMPVTTISRQNFDNSHYNNQKYDNKRFHTDSEMQYEGEIKRLKRELKKSESIINTMKIKQLEGQVAKLKEKDKVYDQIISSLIIEKQKNAQTNKKQIKQQTKEELEQQIRKSLKKKMEKQAQQLKQTEKRTAQLKRSSSLDKYVLESQKLDKKKPESLRNETKNTNSEQKRAKTQMQEEQIKKASKQATNYHVIADHQKQIQTQKQFMLINPERTREKLQKCYFQLKRFTVPQININPFRIPKIPNPPKFNQSVDDYLRVAKQLCECLNYHVQQIDIVIRRYKNCISFRLVEKGLIVIWGFDGKLYVGQWVQLKEGDGKKQGAGMEFTRQFHDNKKSGIGIAQFYNGNVYEGEWQNGKMDGKGIYFEKTNAIYYQGQWDKGELRGRGYIKYNKKHFYTGQLSNFSKSGKGTEFYENGDIYEGSFEKGEQNGYGIFYSSSGQFYVGYFKNSLKNGTGLLLTNKFGQKQQKEEKIESYYYGQFLQGVRSGYGVQRNIQNSYYLGYFFKDLPHGPGILQNTPIFQKNCNKNTMVKLSGIWKNGKIIVKNRNIEPSQKSQSRDFSEKN